MRTLAALRRHPFVTVMAVACIQAVVLVGPAPAAGLVGTAPSETVKEWVWPVGPPHQLLRPFEAPPTRYAAGHRGIDVAASPGMPVLSSADGVVSFAGVVVDRPVVSVRHAGGLVSSIEPVTASVGAGATVVAGQVVGVVASGGHCDDRCLHVGVRLHGEYLNPLALLESIERAVLLPLGR